MDRLSPEITRLACAAYGLLSLLLLTLFSACSWLYPLNPWDDANCFTTIAESMLEGKILYRDIFDQKGPLLFILHVLSAWICDRPFFGIYILQIVCQWIFLVYSLKTVRLFVSHSIRPWLEWASVALVGLLCVTSEFYYYGDSVEEFSLPVLAYGLYLFLRYAREGILPGRWAACFLGLGFAWVFWMKFTVLALLGGCCLAVLVIAAIRREMKTIWSTVGWILVGFMAGSAAVLAFFVPQHTVADVFEGYFGYNLFHYHLYSEDTESEMGFFPLRWLAFFILMTPICVVRCRRDVRIMLAFSWAFALILMVLTTVYIYYFLVLFIYLPLLAALLLRSWREKTLRTVFCGLAFVAVCANFNFVQLVRGDFPQGILSVRKFIYEHRDDCEGCVDSVCSLREGLLCDHSREGLLCYHSRETGIYTYSDYSAPIRHFFQLSVVHQDYLDEQEDYINSAACRYVIMKDGYLNHPDYELVFEQSELFRTLLFIRPLIWLYNQTHWSAIKPNAEVENAIPTVANATYSTFRLYEYHPTH